MNVGYRYNLSFYTRAGQRRAQGGNAEPLPERALPNEVIQAVCVNGPQHTIWIDRTGHISQPAWATGV